MALINRPRPTATDNLHRLDIGDNSDEPRIEARDPLSISNGHLVRRRRFFGNNR